MENTNLTMKIPTHLAIILDGNGRWAQKKGLIRSLGHKAGANALKETTNNAFKMGVKVLSVFCFSTENWKRDKEEVDYLMDLLVTQFKKLINKNDNVKIVFSGSRNNLRDDVIKAIDEIQELIIQKDYETAKYYIVSLQLLMGLEVKFNKVIYNMMQHSILVSDFVDKDKYFGINNPYANKKGK